MTKYDGLRLVVVGAGAGLLAAAYVSSLLNSLLYEVGSSDPVVFVVAPLVLSLVALVAILVPAVRAARVDPARSLADG